MEHDFGRTLEGYKVLLEKARKELPKKVVHRSRFVIPVPEVEIVGRKKTVIRNFKEIADVLHRPPQHIAKYFTKVLATPATTTGKELIIRGQHPKSRIVQVLKNYVQEYVICPICGSPDTELVTISGILYKRCKACGARTPVRELRAIFQHQCISIDVSLPYARRRISSRTPSTT